MSSKHEKIEDQSLQALDSIQSRLDNAELSGDEDVAELARRVMVDTLAGYENVFGCYPTQDPQGKWH